MISSLFGEYIENIYAVEPYVKVATENLYHRHPKVRYSALHLLGQFSTDLQPAYQAHFGENLLKLLISGLDDEFPRLKAHAAASLTNFLEGATDDIVENYINDMVTKLLKLIQEGNTMCMENAVTWLATVAEASENRFQEYYEPVMKELSPYLQQDLGLKYYQFKGQLIESIVIISVSVGSDTFKPHADDLITLLMSIQNSIFNETGVTESNTTLNKSSEHHVLQSYLLTAWEKLSYLIGVEFKPYLSQIIPSLLKVASLNPEFKTSENNSLITTDEEGGNFVTSETEEKKSAIEMIEAFVNELKEHFAEYVEPITHIILPMLTYKHSDHIRTSSVKCIKGLMESIVGGCPDNRDLQVQVAEKYIETIWEATKVEEETETLGMQWHAIRDVIKAMKTPFMSEDVVNKMCKRCIQMISNSDKRKLINDDYTEENINTQGDNYDHQDVEIMEIENDNEDEFQISISEIFGALFQTHREFCGALCQTLFNDMLPNYLSEESDLVKKRFSLYVVVDMIEHLGYEYITEQFEPMMKYLFEYSKCEVTVLRQSALYGIGMAWVHCKDHFSKYLEPSIDLLKYAVEIKQGSQDREEYINCKDNAISSIGKIIKQFGSEVNMDELIAYWIEIMPVQMDLEEGKHMNSLLADLIIHKHEVIFGEKLERLPNVLTIIGEQLHEIYMETQTIQEFGRILLDISKTEGMKKIFDNVVNKKLDQTAKKRIKKAMKEASG
jgi:importin-5